MSEKLIDRLFENPKLDRFPEEDIKFVKSLITGEGPQSRRTWCSDTPESMLNASYSIICKLLYSVGILDLSANREFGIDVDRFDYLQRDQMIGGMNQQNELICNVAENLRFFKANRIMEFAKVINGQICFRDKEHDNVFKLFESRYWMFKWVIICDY